MISQSELEAIQKKLHLNIVNQNEKLIEKINNKLRELETLGLIDTEFYNFLHKLILEL